MSRFLVRSLSLIHGALAASAWAGVPVPARAALSSVAAGSRRARSLSRSAWILAVVLLPVFCRIALLPLPAN